MDVVGEIELSNQAAQRQAVQHRHVPVGDQEVRTHTLDRRQGLPPVAGLLDLIARLFQPSRDQAAHGGIVIHDQDSAVARNRLIRDALHIQSTILAQATFRAPSLC